MVGRRATRQTHRREPTGSDVLPDSKIFPEVPSAPASVEDKARWKGFCEIESEPAFFNVMLKQFGVEGVKVQEVVSLDDEILVFLPRPVYGLIFLFKWIEEDSDKQEQSCPEGVWFANQTINNACASVALLNIVNNTPDLEIGDQLRAFRDFTASFSPALRGDAIGNFEFVKGIHNSFARKMDMLNTDLLLQNEVTSNTKAKKRKADEDESESGFHFIAFMPIQGHLWKLDGLERQPMCLGTFDDDWLHQAKEDIEARMAQYDEGQLEFSILSLARNPLLNLVPKLAENAKSISKLSARLDELKSDWRDFDIASVDNVSSNILLAPDTDYGLTQEDLDRTELPEDAARLCTSEVVEDIIAKRQQLATAQAELRCCIKEEQQAIRSDEERALARKCDYGARMQEFVRKVKTKRRALGEAEGI